MRPNGFATSTLKSCIMCGQTPAGTVVSPNVRWFLAMLWSGYLTNAILLLCPMASSDAGETWQVNQPVPALKQSTEFRKALQLPISVTWDHVPLRDVLRQLRETQAVAVLLDRRVDPTTEVHLELQQIQLAEAYARLSDQQGLLTITCGHTLYLGPPASARWLRTTIAQRDAELEEEVAAIAKPRQSALRDRKTIHWSDFATPREILDQIAQRYQLTIHEAEMVPHDLWATATLPYATATESLSLVLNQCELDFQWQDQGSAIKIMPWQIPQLIAREFPLKKSSSAAEVWQRFQAEHPEIPGEARGQQIVIRGRVEDHELFAEWLNPTRQPKPASDPSSSRPLTQRRFTLQVENAPIRLILAELEKSGVTLAYDAEELAAAGINLQQPVSLNVKQVTIDEFLQAILAPLPLRFEVDQQTIRLAPRTDPKP